MKIAIVYPPLDTKGGTPLLSQNRQFQYFREPTYIYPVVPAYAATLLNEAGFEVKWKDCIAEGINEVFFSKFIEDEKPDLIAMETKTPVVKQHWKMINRLKTIDQRLKTVLFGDHVTALPEESFLNSNVDFVLAGGDYDFLLLNLCRNFNIENDTLNINNLESGVFYRNNGEVRNTGKFKLNHDLNSLPFINRQLTHWKLYAYKNGNFKRTPATYIMSGRDCWWSKCSFCSWPSLYPEFRARKVENVLDEIGELINTYKIKEIMDDTGTFPIGDWLKDFCNGMIDRGYNKRIHFDCNMRFGVLNFDEYILMKKAGFRLILFGLESANQATLDRINKNLKVEEIISSCQLARKAGLYPHITIMFGYPWESYEEAQKTLNLGRWLLKKGYAYTVQATVVIPYPGSSLFKECKINNELTTENWDNYDMKKLVMKIKFQEDKALRMVQNIYNVAYSPEFIIRRIMSIRDINDIIFFFKGFNRVTGHIFDFKS